ncbi:ankyrin repeat domain-containing protein [Spiroplasma endosymbiont of Phycita roborella]|uniref:ankyrin repeat domain-containing protein n=1 Tax=Spiroplasma endosymbiont of Phycita roborella TaxID=3066311 RepID=UPI003CC7A4F0
MVIDIFDTLPKILIKNDININRENNVGENALIWAARNGHTEVINALLTKNSDIINHKTKYGNNALIWAAKEGHLDVVNTLIKNDIDITHLDANGDSALTWATRNGHLEIQNIINESNYWKEQINSIDLQNHNLQNKCDKSNSLKI